MIHKLPIYFNNFIKLDIIKKPLLKSGFLIKQNKLSYFLASAKN